MPPFVDRLFKSLAHGVTLAEAIRRATPQDAHILEIGPGASPTFRRKDFPFLKVSDYCDSAELHRSLERHAGGRIEQTLFDEVDYVCADGRLADVVPEGQKFDLIFTSHNIEHQPNLLTHFVNVEKLLGPQGVATFLVPHRGYTFDVFRQLTTTSDVLLGHFGPPGLMSAKAAFDSHTQGANLPAGAPRAYGNDAPIYLSNLTEGFDRLMRDLRGEPREFQDCHHHIFTTASLHLLFVELYLLRLTTLLPCTWSEVLGNTFLMVVTPTPWPQDAEQAAAVQAQLEAQRLACYKKMAFPQA